MRKILLLLLICTTLAASAQRRGRRGVERPLNTGNALLVHFGYGIHSVGGDLADRFGPNNNSLMVAAEYLTTNNYFFNAQAHFHYGSKVDEDPLTNLRTIEGGIIGSDRALADVFLRQRGQHFGLQVGKLFPFGNTRSGLRVGLGAGYMLHKIRIQDDRQSLIQIRDDYKKGYDRFTGGWALTQFVGYQRVPLKRGLTFFAGIELEEGFTKSLRDWDFNTKMKDDRNRFDLRYGFRAGFSLPFFFLQDAGELIY